MSPIENVLPATNAVLPSCASRIVIAAVVFLRDSSIWALSRFSGGVRIRPQNRPWIAGAHTESCQSIQLLERARVLRSEGSSEPAPCLAARQRTTVFDSQ